MAESFFPSGVATIWHHELGRLAHLALAIKTHGPCGFRGYGLGASISGVMLRALTTGLVHIISVECSALIGFQGFRLGD